MLLCLSGVAFCAVDIWSLNLGGKSLKVRIDDVRGWQLLVVVLECELVLILLGHLHPDCSLPNPSELGSMSIQQVFPSVAIRTALAEVLALQVLALLE